MSVRGFDRTKIIVKGADNGVEVVDLMGGWGWGHPYSESF